MAWTPEHREALLAAAREARQQLKPPKLFELEPAEYAEIEAREQALLMEYAENLPYHELSRCPICETPLSMPIDLVGLDGPWWWMTCPVELPPEDACEHFRLFQGALHLGTRTPSEVREAVMVGPGAPFVIDRLLGIEGMKAVLSQFRLKTGDTAFLIAYFSEAPVDQSELHQNWRKEKYPIRNEDGEIIGAEYRNDPWNFALEPWIENGTLAWIAPGDSELALRTDLPSPFGELEGTHQKQILMSGKVHLWAPPHGQESARFETA